MPFLLLLESKNKQHANAMERVKEFDCKCIELDLKKTERIFLFSIPPHQQTEGLLFRTSLPKSAERTIAGCPADVAKHFHLHPDANFRVKKHLVDHLQQRWQATWKDVPFSFKPTNPLPTLSFCKALTFSGIKKKEKVEEECMVCDGCLVAWLVWFSGKTTPEQFPGPQLNISAGKPPNGFQTTRCVDAFWPIHAKHESIHSVSPGTIPCRWANCRLLGDVKSVDSQQCLVIHKINRSFFSTFFQKLN